MEGTIRTLDSKMQKEVHERIRKTVKSIAESYGATAEVTIDTKTLVTYNDPQLVAQSLPSLQKALGENNVVPYHWVTGAEDFSYYGPKRRLSFSTSAPAIRRSRWNRRPHTIHRIFILMTAGWMQG
jgi:metal-dependent amidase/aminoacylase/carboxypeptidase family protein